MLFFVPVAIPHWRVNGRSSSSSSSNFKWKKNKQVEWSFWRFRQHTVKISQTEMRWEAGGWKKSIKEWKEIFFIHFFCVCLSAVRLLSHSRSLARAGWKMKGKWRQRKGKKQRWNFRLDGGVWGLSLRKEQKMSGWELRVEKMKMNKEKGSFLFFNFSAVLLSWTRNGKFWGSFWWISETIDVKNCLAYSCELFFLKVNQVQLMSSSIIKSKSAK